MSHVRADRLAELARGRLSESKAAQAQQHLSACTHCRTVLSRIESAQAAMREVVDAPVPEAGTVRTEATIRWMRVRPEPAVRPAFWAAAALTGCAAALALFAGRFPAHAPSSREAPSLAVKPAPRPPVAADAELAAVITLLGGKVELVRDGHAARLEMGSTLRVQDKLTTGASSRVAAQWAEGSGLLLLADAQLSFDRFQTRTQRLGLERGEVDVRVGAKIPGESLQVTTPSHIVTVKGTWFTVAADGPRTTVEVLEGTVEVSELDGSRSTLLHAPSRAVFTRGRFTSAALDVREAAALRAKSELNLMSWTGPSALLSVTGLLRVSSVPDGTLAVDGVELGSTPLQVRRPFGRHYVELQRLHFHPITRWVTLDGDEPGELRVAFNRVSDVPPPEEPPSLESVMLERKGVIRTCYERSLKRDDHLTGTVSLRLRIGAHGAVTQTAIEDSTMPDPQVGECLQHEAARWTFSRGKNVTVIYPFEFKPE